MKYSVLTYIFDGYENLHEICFPQDDVEYICVTDDRTMTSRSWKIVYDDSLDGLDTFEKCYRVRFNPFKYCTTDVCVRIDGSMRVIGSLDRIVDDFNKGGFDICLMVHPSRTTLREEYDEWCKTRNYDRRLADDALDYCSFYGYDVNNYKGLYQLCFAIYRNNAVNEELNRRTYRALKEIGRSTIHRIDQTIYSYVVNTYRKNPLNVMFISQNYVVYGQALQWCAHKSNKPLSSLLHRVPLKGYAFNNEIELYQGTYVTKAGKKGKPLCVFSVPMCPKGELIYNEMIPWLSKDFYVHVVHHDGSLFEYFGLKYMQDLCLRTKKSCMYIHAKGAYNNHEITKVIRTFWQAEFGNGKAARYYQAVAEDKPRICGSFTGQGNAPWYNCFVANWQAMQTIGEIPVTDNRFDYEDRLFRGKDVEAVGLIMDDIDINTSTHKKMHQWLFSNYPTFKMATRDIVYVVGSDSQWHNNELRYSLRSIEKYGNNVGDVFIVGNIHDFITGCKTIEVSDTAAKNINIYKKIDAAVYDDRVRNEFLVSSDDHFYTRGVDFFTYPLYHFGKIEDVVKKIPKGDYRRMVERSLQCLNDANLPTYMTNPHCNTLISKTIWKKWRGKIDDMMKQGCIINLLIGNIMMQEGYKFVQIEDCKLREPHTYAELLKIFKDNECVSIDDCAINADFIEFMANMYPFKSQYESYDIGEQKKEEVYCRKITRAQFWGFVN